MASNAPVLSAVSSSARTILLLIRCISFAKKALVRISPEGLRFSSEESSAMEAFVFLESSLFTSYTYRPSPAPSSQDDPAGPPIFEINMTALLETLNIFSLSDPNVAKRPNPYDDFAIHRLNRHSNLNPFSNSALGLTGLCTFTYQGEGSPLSIHMSEAGGPTTTSDLTTYDAASLEEIPFDRENLALKTIMRSSYLLDAFSELSAMDPSALTLTATPSTRRRSGTNLSLSAEGALGSVAVDFEAGIASETPILETFFCPAKTSATFRFASIKAAQRAMAAATKVSIRLDDESVLSLQFLIHVDTGAGTGLSAGKGGMDGEGEGKVAFVDFRVVPLVDEDDGEDEGDGTESDE